MGILDLIGHKYPFTDFHELNLDWCITAILQLQKYMEDFSAGNKLIFADPLQHDLTKTYAKNTIVVDPVSGTAYLSLQEVAKGVQLDNTDYWLPVFDFASYVTRANKNFTDNYFSGTDRTPVELEVGDWVVLDDVLYEVIEDMAVDDPFIIGTNIIHFTVEQFLKDFISSVTRTITDWRDDMIRTINQYKNDIDASEVAYRAQLAQDIAGTTASLQAQLDAAIAGATVDSEVINARVAWNDQTFGTLKQALDAQFINLLEFTNNEFDESPFIVGTNLYNPNTFNKLTGLYVSHSNGGVYTAASNSAVAIKVEGGEVLSINKPWVNLAFFDKWQPISVYQANDIIEGYISGVAGDVNNMLNVSIPANAKMATISVATSALSSLQINYGATIQPAVDYEYKLPNSAINDDLIDTVYRKALLQSTGKNLFNKDTSEKITGNYVGYSTSQVIANASYSAYVVEIDDDNSALSVNEPYVHVAFYSRIYDITSYTTGQYLPYYISGATGDASGLENASIPSGAKMAVVSIKNSNVSSVQVEYGAQCTSYEPYVYGISGTKIWPDSIPEDRLQKYTHYYTVKADNTGDFDSLRDCFNAISALSDRGRVLVEIYEGTYDIRADYTNEEWAAVGFVGLTVPHDVSLIGIGLKDDILITCTSETPTSAISTLNVTYNVDIENLTIYGEALRYTIHDDYSINGKDLKTIVKNCDIIGNDLVYDWVWGAGTYGGSYKEFDNVRFINLSGGNTFSTHDSVSPSDNAECQIFNNCEFIGLIRGRIRISPAKSGVTQTIIFNGCMFDLLLISSQYTGDDSSTTVYNLIGHGNTADIATSYYNDHDKLTVPRFGDRTHAGKNASGSTINAGDYVKRSVSPAGMVIGTSDNNDGIAINTVADGGIVYFK